MKVFSQAQVERIGQLETSAAVLAEVLAINTALSDLQARVSRMAEMLATTKIVLPANGSLDEILSIVEREMGPPRGATIQESTSPSNRDGSTDGKASSGAVPQDEVPQAGTGSEMLADREGHIAEGAGEDEASAADRRSDPAPTPVRSELYDRVLDAYAASTESSSQVGKQIGVLGSTVRAYVSMGRAEGDPRVLKGEAARNKQFDGAVQAYEAAAQVQPAPAPKQAPRVVSEDPEPATRLRPPSLPPVQRKPVEAPLAPVKVRPSAGFDPGKIVAADVDNLRLFGPLGEIDVSRPFALIVSRMADGGIYDASTLKELGSWQTLDGMRQHFTLMSGRLKAIGVELVYVSKELFKLRRLEA